MAETLLTIEEVSKELQLSKDQILAMVKKGLLRGFRDQQTYKFRRPDVESFRKQLASDATLAMTAAGEDKVDLGGIEAEPGADDSDQTSVLQPVDEEDKGKEKHPSKPSFSFSEEELGLALEEEGAAPAAAGKKEEKKPTLPIGELPDESILVADESESSVDILEAADESSSDTHTSDSNFAVVEESSEVVPSVPETKAPAPRVSDVLGKAAADEEIETIDLDQVVETQETPLEEGEVFKTETAGTVPLGDEAETVGVSKADTTEGVAELPESALAGLAEGEEVGVGELPPEAEEAEVEAGVAPTMVAPGWETILPSKLGNAMLLAATVLLAFTALFLLWEAPSPGSGYPRFLQGLLDALANIGAGS